MSLGELLFPKLELKLIIARSSDTDIKATQGKDSTEYIESAARIRMNEVDLKRLNIKEGDTVSIKNKIGQVVVKAYIDEGVDSSIGVMPYSPWALVLVNVSTEITEIQLQGLSVEVTRSDEEVTSLDGLLDSP